MPCVRSRDTLGEGGLVVLSMGLVITIPADSIVLQLDGYIVLAICEFGRVRGPDCHVDAAKLAWFGVERRDI